MYFRFSPALRLGDIDDNPYQLRGPFARGISRAPRGYTPLRLGDDNDWLRSGSLLRRTSSPLSRLGLNNGRGLRDVRRSQLASRGLRGGLRRGSFLDDEISIMDTAGRGLRRGLRLDDDNDNWASSVMNRGRSLARGGLFGRGRGDDDDNSLWRSPLSGSNRIGRTSLSQRLNDDDNNYENIFGRRALGNSLQGLRNVATSLRLDDDDDNVLTRGISPLRNSFPMPQFNLNDDDDGDRFSSLSSLRSSLGGPLAGRRFF